MNRILVDNNTSKSIYYVIKAEFYNSFIIQEIHTDPSINSIYKSRAKYIENVYIKNLRPNDQDNSKSKCDLQFLDQEKNTTEIDREKSDSSNMLFKSKSIFFHLSNTLIMVQNMNGLLIINLPIFKPLTKMEFRFVNLIIPK